MHNEQCQYNDWKNAVLANWTDFEGKKFREKNENILNASISTRKFRLKISIHWQLMNLIFFHLLNNNENTSNKNVMTFDNIKFNKNRSAHIFFSIFLFGKIFGGYNHAQILSWCNDKEAKFLIKHWIP